MGAGASEREEGRGGYVVMGCAVQDIASADHIDFRKQILQHQEIVLFINS